MKRILVFLPVLIIAACATTVNNANLLAPSDQTLALRQIQTRAFDTLDEKKLLQASAQVLQDLGFTITESEVKLGMIAAEKERSAVEPGDVAVSAGIVIIGTLIGLTPDFVYDNKQNIWVALVATPVPDSTRINIRITFARVIWDNRGKASRRETIADAVIYQEFFRKLEQSVFLTANEI